MRTCLAVTFIGLLLASARPVRADFVSQVLADNPAGFWLLNDASTTAADSSGNAFSGTYGAGVTPQGTAGPSWVPGSGLVADFNGSGNITFPGPLNLGPSEFTIQAWINPTLASLQNTSRIVASSSAGFTGYGFGTTTGGELVFTAFSVKDYETTSLNLTPNQWYYVGVVLDASNSANFYVNGVLRQTVTGPGPTSAPTGNFSIGSRSPPTPDEFFTGGLAGISVYTTALSSTQIQDQYNAAIVPEPSSVALIGLGAAFAAGCTWRQRRRKAGSRSGPALTTLLLLLLTAALPSRARADFIFTLSQVGPDVVATGSGTLNLTDLTLLDPSFPFDGVLIEPSSAVLAVGVNLLLRRYEGISGPASWGPGGITNATTSSGDLVVIAGLNPFLYVPTNYVSGALLANTATFSNTTVPGLGFVPGTYTYTWGSGVNADSLTVTSVVPEPATWALVGAGLLTLAGVLRHRKPDVGRRLFAR